MLIFENLLKSFSQCLTSILQKTKSLYEQITLNFVTKNLRKAIMKRSRLRNIYVKERTKRKVCIINSEIPA